MRVCVYACVRVRVRVRMRTLISIQDQFAIFFCILSPCFVPLVAFSQAETLTSTTLFRLQFLDANMHLYKRVCLSVRSSVRPFFA